MVMRTGVALVGLAQIQNSLAEAPPFHGYKSSKDWLPRAPVGKAPPAEMLVADAALPDNFDWRDIGGRSYVTADLNQHIPQYCGACWVHGTVSALNDRIKVLRGAKFPDVMLGRQAIVNCVPPMDGKGSPPGCEGGDPQMIHNYMHTNKIPDDSCLPYQAKNMGCEPVNVCRNCKVDNTCYAVDNFIGYSVSSFGNVAGEAAMMKEIYARGPIVCSFSTDHDFMFTYSEVSLQNEGVYLTSKKYNVSQIDHNMEVTGWGETPSGLKYWVVRNSWGTYWGEAGWLKLRRGTNELFSEYDCQWAVPAWDDLDEALEGKILGDYVQGDLTLAQTESKIDGRVFGQEALAATGGADGAQALTSAVTFLAGVSVALAAVKLSGTRRVREQPLMLG